MFSQLAVVNNFLYISRPSWSYYSAGGLIDIHMSAHKKEIPRRGHVGKGVISPSTAAAAALLRWIIQIKQLDMKEQEQHAPRAVHLSFLSLFQMFFLSNKRIEK